MPKAKSETPFARRVIGSKKTWVATGLITLAFSSAVKYVYDGITLVQSVITDWQFITWLPSQGWFQLACLLGGGFLFWRALVSAKADAEADRALEATKAADEAEAARTASEAAMRRETEVRGQAVQEVVKAVTALLADYKKVPDLLADHAQDVEAKLYPALLFSAYHSSAGAMEIQKAELGAIKQTFEAYSGAIDTESIPTQFLEMHAAHMDGLARQMMDGMRRLSAASGVEPKAVTRSVPVVYPDMEFKEYGARGKPFVADLNREFLRVHRENRDAIHRDILDVTAGLIEGWKIVKELETRFQNSVRK